MLSPATQRDMTHLLLHGSHSAHGNRSGSAAAGHPIAEELLNPFRGIDFPCVDVSFAVNAHLMKVVEFSSVSATASEPAQFLQIASVQDVDGHVGVVANVEATLC